MNFEEFQSVCRFAKYGVKDGYSDQFELTCRRSDRIPSGHSWGKCSEMTCPYFGIIITGGTLYNEETGEVLMELAPGRIVLGPEKE
jgi:hypothetical protein